MHAVTIKDIARTLMVAPSTVSMALNDHPRISEKTKRRVKAIARKLRYRPMAYRGGLTMLRYDQSIFLETSKRQKVKMSKR